MRYNVVQECNNEYDQLLFNTVGIYNSTILYMHQLLVISTTYFCCMFPFAVYACIYIYDAKHCFDIVHTLQKKNS